jgi:hypothetical protein
MKNLHQDRQSPDQDMNQDLLTAKFSKCYLDVLQVNGCSVFSGYSTGHIILRFKLNSYIIHVVNTVFALVLSDFSCTLKDFNNFPTMFS